MPKSWRDVLPIHPAAELFPLMSPDELKALGEDIRKNALTSPIALWRASPAAQLQLLDGRNRLDAIEIIDKCPAIKDASQIEAVIKQGKAILLHESVDPYAYVISANLHRRHLTAEQKRELIAELIKAQPEKPDLQIAKTVKASPTTVGTVRRGMEAKGDVSKLETRRDIKGRQQPARKPRDLKKEQRARAIRKLQNRDGLPSADELMNASDDKLEEIFSAQSMIDRLREEKRALEIKVAGLESEVEELRGRLKAGGDMSFPEFQIAIKKYEETVEVQRGIIARLENEKLRAGVGPPPADDGLDIPGFLDRTTQGAAS